MTLRAEFDSYRQKVMPPAAGPTQVVECRRAFYAGALAFFICMSAGLSADEEVNDDDVTRLDRLHKELMAFGAAGGDENYGRERR